ncbi:MAG: DUF3018 family protein [Gammaproteobacteria bacterium]|nr:DUF3018 family protein [Gammaproteobacteria bacterium]
MSEVTTPKSNPSRQAAHRERLRAAGLVPITEWIPPESKELVRGICKRLREGKTKT